MAEKSKEKKTVDYSDESQLQQRLSEIDKLIAKENIDRESLFDSFDSNKNSNFSSSASSKLNHSQSSRAKENKTAHSKRDYHKKRKTSAHNIREKEKPHKHTKAKKSQAHSISKEKNVSKGRFKALVIIFVFVVFLAAGITVFLYLNGFASPDSKDSLSSVNPSQTTINPQEHLAVITVSDKTISFNGKELSSIDELESKLENNSGLTLSLINIGADTEVYNQVATILNNHGGSYELMDSKNTNPSINTDIQKTTAPIEENQEDTSANSTESMGVTGENQE